MTTTLRDEIQQYKPFTSPQQEAFLNIARTQAVLFDAFEKLLRPHGISFTQYNVLRVLRGAEQDGLCRNEVRDRLLTRMPDVTRLLDRMEDRHLPWRLRKVIASPLSHDACGQCGVLRLCNEMQCRFGASDDHDSFAVITSGPSSCRARPAG